jgi:hypothetical protein
VVNYDVTTRLVGGTTATVTLRIQDSVHTASATGQGPMNALDLCLRQCLSNVYPQVKERPPDRLQGPRAGAEEGHGGQGSRAGGMVRSSPKLGHRRRFRQRDRSQLGRAGGLLRLAQYSDGSRQPKNRSLTVAPPLRSTLLHTEPRPSGSGLVTVLGEPQYRMVAMAATTLLTSDQFLAMPEEFDQHGNRIKDELIGGEVVSERPSRLTSTIASKTGSTAC